MEQLKSCFMQWGSLFTFNFSRENSNQRVNQEVDYVKTYEIDHNKCDQFKIVTKCKALFSFPFLFFVFLFNSLYIFNQSKTN